ncbi:MAG TPA: O-antigen ligase family protein [Bryobacteraceae bacterium]|nr:O-antigen ligase family protein [Bryobacteraceae bacterium]
MLLALAAAAVPLAIAPGWSFYFDVVPRIVILLAGAALALWFSGRIPAGSLFLKLLAAQAAVAAIATIFSIDAVISWSGAAWRKEGLPVELAVLIFAAAIYIWLSAAPERLRPFLRVTVFGALPAAIYGIAQYFGIDPLLASFSYRAGEGQFAIVRPPSTLGHADYFATFLLYPLFAGIFLARLESRRAWKIAALSTSLLVLAAMILSGTRAALAGALAGAVLILARGRFSRRRVFQAIAPAAAALALFTVFYRSPAGERLRARVHWSREDRLGGARLLLWRDTLKMSESRWLAGYGPETFVREFPKHESADLARAYPDFYHESPHNIFIEALVSKGLPGLAALLAISAFGVMLARGAMGAAFVAILVSQQFTSFTATTELYFYICLAILAAMRAQTPNFALSARSPLRLALAAPFACFAIFLLAGDAMLARAASLIDRGDVSAAAATLKRARVLRASADIYFSRRFAAFGADPAARLLSWEAGFDAAKSAVETADDRMNALVNLASFYAGQNDAANVEKTLRAAIAAAPNWYKPHWLLSRVLSAEGRAAEARAEAQIAASLNGAPLTATLISATLISATPTPFHSFGGN